MPSVRRPSIAQAILLLVVAAVATATAINFAITFNGPPPKDPPRGIESIAHALTSGRQPGDPGPRLALRTQRAVPRPNGAERPDAAAARGLAATLGVPPSAVVAYTSDRPAGIPDAFVGGFTFGLRIAPATWRVASNQPGPAFTRWHWTTLGAMLATLALLSFVGWLIARTIARPLRRLAAAAAQAQAGTGRPGFPDDGPREVRALTAAVSAMHDRLAGHAEARTTMLAAIAHDLGTPLSRLAFWIERLPEPARDRAAADLHEMRLMLAEVLRFARDERIGGRVRLDLGSALDSLVDDLAAAGRPVTLIPGPRVLVESDPVALRRLFMNLIENAIRYGLRAQVGWTVADGAAVVTVDDAGPGFDPALGDRAFEPFVRGDPSRNRATGGSGLGLAIVRALTQAHGGTVTLGIGPEGGRVTVELPADRAAAAA